MNTLLENIHTHEVKGSIRDLVAPVSNTYDFSGKSQVIFINTGDVHEGKFLHRTFMEVSELPGQAKKIIERGDILFSEIRPKNRHFALVDFDAKDYVVSTKLIVLKVKESVDPSFAYIVLTADKNLREFQNIAESRSGTFPQITFDSIADFQVRLPDLSTQKKIAEIIGAYNEKITNNDLVIETSDAIIDATFEDWFVKFQFPGHESVDFVESEMGEIPTGWEVRSVMDVIERIGVGKKYDNKSALPFGMVPILDQGQSGFIGYHNDEPGVVANLEKPVVIFTNHTCYYRLLTEPFSCIQNVLPYVGKDGYSTLFVYFLTKGKIKMQEYKGHWPEFEQQIFVIPPVAIANQFADKIKTLVENMVVCEKENALLRQFRDRLLAKLI